MASFVRRLSRSFNNEKTPGLPAPTGDPEPDNKLMIEAFEWYSPADGQHWKRIKEALPTFKELGVTTIWIPPACKAGSPNSNGYDVYDLYDLGEFDQKGHVATKWGSKDELADLGRAAKSQGIGLIFDAVLNHKGNADYTQHLKAQRVHPQDRRKTLEKPHNIEAWLGFNYEGRGGKHSQMAYSAEHFNSTDYDNTTKSHGIYKFKGKDWAKDVDKSNGNFDYLLSNNVDLSHPDVRKDLQHWVEWLGKELDIAGLRFDAAKHMSQSFMRDYVRHIRQTVGRDWLLVGEYATEDDSKVLLDCIKKMDSQLRLFDFPLLRNFRGISRHEDADLRFIFGGTLAEKAPRNAVTFVTNHDTQPRAGSDSVSESQPQIEAGFVPVAYATILLSRNGVYPCLFWGDLYGVSGPNGPKAAAHGKTIAKLAMIRKLYAYGQQNEYFDDRSCIGFTRAGNTAHSNGAGVAVVVSKSKQEQSKRMNVGRQHAGERWTEILGNISSEVEIADGGWGQFPIPACEGSGRVAVWSSSAALGRGRLDTTQLAL